MTKNIKSQELSKKILPTLKSMRIFQMESWPIQRMHTVYATVTKVKAIEGKNFKVHCNRENNTLEVTRIS